MKKKINDLTLKLWIESQFAKKKVLDTFGNQDGGALTEHGVLIVGVILIVLLAIGAFLKFTEFTFIPKLEDKSLEVFDMK